MNYVYIGFMLAIGGCFGIALFLFFWRKPSRIAKVALYAVYLLAGIWVVGYYWAKYPHPWAELVAWLQTRNGIIVAVGAAGITIIFIAELLRPQYQKFISLSPCATCGHAQRRHRDRHCLESACQCSYFVERCPACKHSEFKHNKEKSKCLVEGCSCRVRPNIKGAVIVFSLAIVVFVLLIVVRGSAH